MRLRDTSAKPITERIAIEPQSRVMLESPVAGDASASDPLTGSVTAGTVAAAAGVVVAGASVTA